MAGPGHGVTSSGVASPAATMTVPAVGLERTMTITWDAVSVAALLYLAIMGSAVTFSLYFWLLSHLPAKRLALIAYIIPVEAVLIGTFRNEPITLRVILGASLVIAGVALAVHRAGHKKEVLAKGTT